MKNTASIIFRSKDNVHRFFCFVNGKLRSFLTHEKDFLFNTASLYGNLNGAIFSVASARTALLIGAALAGLITMAPAHAELPTGGQFQYGSGTITNTGNALNITAGNRSIIDFQTYNVGQGQAVNYALSGANPINLSRVTGGTYSQINGQINAPGATLFLVNPAGIVMGPTSQVNVGSIVASTLNISNADFIAGKYVFQNAGSNASVINKGTITAQNNAILLGSAVSNTGTITAPNVAMAVGNKITVGVGTGVGMDVTVDEKLQQKAQDAAVAVSNSGKLSGNAIKLQAELEQGIYNQAVNNAGVIEAVTTRFEGGKVQLLSNRDSAARVVNEGTISANGSVDNAKGACDPGWTCYPAKRPVRSQRHNQW